MLIAIPRRPYLRPPPSWPHGATRWYRVVTRRPYNFTPEDISPTWRAEAEEFLTSDDEHITQIAWESFVAYYGMLYIHPFSVFNDYSNNAVHHGKETARNMLAYGIRRHVAHRTAMPALWQGDHDSWISFVDFHMRYHRNPYHIFNLTLHCDRNATDSHAHELLRSLYEHPDRYPSFNISPDAAPDQCTREFLRVRGIISAYIEPFVPPPSRNTLKQLRY